jgi:predicted RNA binding protein YcfA (HicA-like mRNA interferase family)
MKPLTAKQTARILEANGFVISRQKGSHIIYKNANGVIVPVPTHGGNKPIPIGTFLAIVKQSGVGPESFKSIT